MVQVDELVSCGLGDTLWNSQGSKNRLVQKLTRSLTKGIAFLFLRSGMLSMLYRAPPILQKWTNNGNNKKQNTDWAKFALASLTTTWTQSVKINNVFKYLGGSYWFSLRVAATALWLLTLLIKAEKRFQRSLLWPEGIIKMRRTGCYRSSNQKNGKHD